MSAITDLIYNRTEEDVVELKRLLQHADEVGWSGLTADEKAAYLSSHKGAYNYTDLNRVGQAVVEATTYLTETPGALDAYREARDVASDPSLSVPYDPNIVVNPKTDWTRSDIPTPSQAEQYIADIQTLHGVFTDLSLPAVPGTLNHFTFSDANDIERIIRTVYDEAVACRSALRRKIVAVVVGQFYSDEIYCGGV